MLSSLSLSTGYRSLQFLKLLNLLLFVFLTLLYPAIFPTQGAFLLTWLYLLKQPYLLDFFCVNIALFNFCVLSFIVLWELEVSFSLDCTCLSCLYNSIYFQKKQVVKCAKFTIFFCAMSRNCVFITILCWHNVLYVVYWFC